MAESRSRQGLPVVVSKTSYEDVLMNHIARHKELPPPWLVRGRPVGYSSGAAEQEWKAKVREVVPTAPKMHGGTGLFVDFLISAPTAQAPGFDLDNLLDPVLSAVINGQGWFGGHRPNLRWLAAQKKTTAEPAACMAVRNEVPRLWAESDATVALDDVYPGAAPSADDVEEYAAWIERHMLRRLVSETVGVRLDFADTRVNLGEVTGKAKVLVDGLWPILGGRRSYPDDSRVAALIMRKGITGLGGTVAINVVGLPDGW